MEINSKYYYYVHKLIIHFPPSYLPRYYGAGPHKAEKEYRSPSPSILLSLQIHHLSSLCCCLMASYRKAAGGQEFPEVQDVSRLLNFLLYSIYLFPRDV